MAEKSIPKGGYPWHQCNANLPHDNKIIDITLLAGGYAIIYIYIYG